MWEWILKKLKKTCPVCGHENHIDADECTNCGADISNVKCLRSKENDWAMLLVLFLTC